MVATPLVARGSCADNPVVAEHCLGCRACAVDARVPSAVLRLVGRYVSAPPGRGAFAITTRHRYARTSRYSGVGSMPPSFSKLADPWQRRFRAARSGGP